MASLTAEIAIPDADIIIAAEAAPPANGEAQSRWAALPVAARLRVLRRARPLLAAKTDAFCSAIASSPARNAADTMAAEVLPLLDACQFLEREAEAILRPRRLGRRGLPIWLAGLDAEVMRAPLGRVLVIGPSNYPLFLPGVQTLQALAAGNAAIWKPGAGGRAVAELFARTMAEAGLPAGLLRVTDESAMAAEQEIASGVDKVFLTGSAHTGRAVLRALAETLTPCVAELSGCDAVIVLPTADLERVAKALAFGMRLNGSATCMAPRRIFLVDASASRRAHLVESLMTAFSAIDGVQLAGTVRRHLDDLLKSAAAEGAGLHGLREIEQRPILVTNVKPDMGIAKADLFAPLCMLIEVEGEPELLAAMQLCPYALTASIFFQERSGDGGESAKRSGGERMARSLAARITAGTVLLNDLIVPTADPRVPFGGRAGSGFGVTRGAEGLLEMTAVKVVSARRGSSTRHFEATTSSHAPLFHAVIHARHAGTWSERWRGIRQAIAAGRSLR
jgi:acyl-CoA reductase-like NAD-dependent aldehyde dehydrogenase